MSNEQKKRTRGCVTWVSLALLTAMPLMAQEGDLEAVRAEQKEVQAVLARITPAYVFIGGGSSVCISEDGWILSNHHVAGAAGRSWPVRFTGGQRCMADVVGFDPLGDLSLLKVRDGKGLPFAELGDSESLRVGERVIAVGNPFLLGNGSWEPTVTYGIVSALHRFQDWYMDAIQTDAQINPGNSGGPLFTMEGKVVGINGRIEIRRFMNRVNTGIGYSIPSGQIRRYLPHLKLGGRARHGFIEGLTIGECGDDRYENTGTYGEGIFLAGVDEGTPARAAGLEPGDILFEIDGRRVYNTNRFHGILGTIPQGEWVTVKYRRWSEEKKSWEEKSLGLVLGDPGKILVEDGVVGKFDLGFLPQFFFDGLGVASLEAEGAAKRAGFRNGDRIGKADGREIRSLLDLKQALAGRKAGEKLSLTLLREGGEVPGEIELVARPEEGGPPAGEE